MNRLEPRQLFGGQLEQKSRSEISEGQSIMLGTCQGYFSRAVGLFFFFSLQKMNGAIWFLVSPTHSGLDAHHFVFAQLKRFPLSSRDFCLSKTFFFL